MRFKVSPLLSECELFEIRQTVHFFPSRVALCGSSVSPSKSDCPLFEIQKVDTSKFGSVHFSDAALCVLRHPRLHLSANFFFEIRQIVHFFPLGLPPALFFLFAVFCCLLFMKFMQYCLCCLCNKLARHWFPPKTPHMQRRRDTPESCRARSPALYPTCLCCLCN